MFAPLSRAIFFLSPFNYILQKDCAETVQSKSLIFVHWDSCVEKFRNNEKIEPIGRAANSKVAFGFSLFEWASTTLPTLADTWPLVRQVSLKMLRGRIGRGPLSACKK